MGECTHESKICTVADSIRCEVCDKDLTKEELGMVDATMSACAIIGKESMLDSMIHEFNKDPKLQEACKTLYKGLGELQDAISKTWPQVPWPNF